MDNYCYSKTYTQTQTSISQGQANRHTKAMEQVQETQKQGYRIYSPIKTAISWSTVKQAKIKHIVF